MEVLLLIVFIHKSWRGKSYGSVASDCVYTQVLER